MKNTTGYTRRHLVRTGTAAGIATALGLAFSAAGTRLATAQNGDTELLCNADGVHIRKDPSLSGVVIGFLNSGAVVNVIGDPVTEDGYSWLPISPQADRGRTGWAAAQFLETGGGWAAGTVVRVADGPLNLRRSAGTGSGVILSYGTGTVATVISGPVAGNGYNWYRVEIQKDGNVGWFAGQFLEVSRTEPTGDRLRVVDGPLRLRRNPGLNGAVVTTLSTGAIVVVADATSVRQDGYLWRYVRLESNRDVFGYIADGFTERIA